MTKEEKIKEAYGEHYEKVKNHLDENGWLDAKSFHGEATHKGLIGLTMDVLNPYDPKYCYLKRPVSLHGIEDNNGWIKIESEQDLPKISDRYYVRDMFREDPYIAVFEEALKNKWMEIITHYQPIVNPKPPIY